MKNKKYPEIEILKKDALILAEAWQAVDAVAKHTKSILSKIEKTAAGGANESYVDETCDSLAGVSIGLKDCVVRLLNNYIGCAKNYDECFSGVLMKKQVDEAIEEMNNSPIGMLAKMIKESGRVFMRAELAASFRPHGKTRGEALKAIDDLFKPATANRFELEVEELPCSSESGKISYKLFIGTHEAFEELADTDLTYKK